MLGADLDFVNLVAAGVGVWTGPGGDRLCDRLRLGSWVVGEEGEGSGANETATRVNERWSSPGFEDVFTAAGLCDADALEACGGDVTDGTWAVRAVAMHESDFERARCEVVLASASDGSEFGRARCTRREDAEERSEDVMAGQSSSGAIDRSVCVLAA